MVKWFRALAARLIDSEASAKKARANFVRNQELLPSPWASFEVNGFEDDGRVKVDFTWNQAFVKKIKALGFEAETDQDCVQLFFFASSLRPTTMADSASDDPVQSTAHPQLSEIHNELRT